MKFGASGEDNVDVEDVDEKHNNKRDAFGKTVSFTPCNDDGEDEEGTPVDDNEHSSSEGDEDDDDDDDDDEDNDDEDDDDNE